MKTGGMIKKDVGTPARFVLPALLAAVMAIVMCMTALPGSDAYAMSRPGKVRGIAASAQSDTYIAVTWQKAAHAGGYIVYRASADGYKRVKKLTSGKSTRFDDASLKADTQYSYYVKAYRRSGGRTVYGRPSQKVRAVTDAADPTCEESIYSTYADSEGFCTFGGVLYAYIGTAESVTVPDNVREIAPDAFSGDLGEGHAECGCGLIGRRFEIFRFRVMPPGCEQQGDRDHAPSCEEAERRCGCLLYISVNRTAHRISVRHRSVRESCK